MTPPLDRRGFLKTVAVVGVLGGTGLPTAAEAAPRYDRTLPAGATYPCAPALLPFGHGVMSGDPLADRVVLWTRITIPDPRGFEATKVPDPQGIREVEVRWVVARDPGLTRVLRRGTVTTTAARDWTVKVDADQLPSATTLYYAFTALGYRSPVGRTRTAPADSDDVTELTVAHVACTSWWQDLFNAYGRIGDRDDLDLVTHAGDHVYEVTGGHPASRFWKDQRRWDTDLDNRTWASLDECRRRYALYYQDRNLLRAHLAAPFAIMADQHDYDDEGAFTAELAGQVLYEWTATRAPLPDGSGRFAPSPGPDVNLPVPTGRATLFSYRTLPYGRLAQVVLVDVRRFAEDGAQQSQVLGDAQWAWLERVLREGRRRGVTFNLVVNGVNLSQLRAFNVPFAEAFRERLGLDPNAPEGEIYPTAWGAHPQERRRLYRFLREQGIVDNVVLSGDSHGWFGSDLVEDAQAPAYEPVTGGGLLGAVGVEMVAPGMGRPGGQDVIAEELYFAAVGGSRGAAFEDAATFDAEYRTAALPAVLALEQAAQAANPNLRYFNWRAEYGHVMVHLRPDRAVVECWTSPQRELATEQTLLRQFSSPVGAPHLDAVLLPRPMTGSRRDAAAPAAETVPPRGTRAARPAAGTPDAAAPAAPVAAGEVLPATGGGLSGAAAVAAVAAVAGSVALRRGRA